MRGRTLEFALATALITIVNVVFAFFVATVIGNKITEIFTNINNVLTSF